MARVARVVIADLPHHLTQGENRRTDVFLDHQDRQVFLRLGANASQRYDTDILSYCLMTNHFHRVSISHQTTSFSSTLLALLGPYPFYFNQKYGLSGRLWQDRFYSCPLDKSHFWADVRSVERNPVRAGMVKKAEDYRWSSAPAHAGLRTDSLLTPLPDTASLIPTGASGFLAKIGPASPKPLVSTPIPASPAVVKHSWKNQRTEKEQVEWVRKTCFVC